MAENQREVRLQWSEGLNQRVSKERRSTKSLNKLQNARLQERGSTLQISRIEGYQQLAGDNTEFDVIYDSLVYDNDLVVYWYDSSSGEVVITFIDVGGAGTTEKRFTEAQADYGELTLLENNIYLTPYDKQLNNINGTWYLNDFISTTPTFELSEYYEGSIQVVDGAGTDSYATGSIDITSQTSIAGTEATAEIQVTSSASGASTITIGFYGETVDVSISDGDDPSIIVSKINNGLESNTSIDNDWETIQESISPSEAHLLIRSRQIGDQWNNESLTLSNATFSYTLDEPTSGGEDNRLTLTFPDQPSDTTLTDSITTSDTDSDIAQKITNAINNKTGLDYTATQNGATVDIEADNLGQQYNGTFGVTQEGLDFTYNKNDFTGGYKATGNFFTISFGSGSISDIDTQTFSSGDSNTQLAQYVYDALVADSDVIDRYTVVLDGDTITLTGESASTLSVTEDISVNNTTVNTTDIQGGNSTLDALSYYWYKLRFVYYDGHKTITSYPKFLKTSSPANSVLIRNIDHQTDLDGNLTDIEVFRKKEGQDWFLIDRVTPDSTDFTYEDDGKTNLQPLDERSYVWSRSPLTQDIVRDRLVQANLEYQSKQLGWSEGDVNFGTTSSSDLSFPKNTEVDIFGQGRFTDGTLSPHKQLGEVSVGSDEVGLTADPLTQPSNVDDLKEIAYYGKFKTKTPTNLTFNSLEIYNQNLPSLATKYKAEAEQDRPINPHIFLGYKYVKIGETINDPATDSDKRLDVFDEDWNYDGTDYIGTDDSTDFNDDFWINGSLFEDSTAIWNDDAPDIIDVNFDADSGSNLYSGLTMNYKLKYQELQGESATNQNYYVYELCWVEPLNKAISEGKAKLKLNSVDGGQLSSLHPNSDYIDNEEDIVGMLDTSEARQSVYFGAGEIWPTGKNHVYLILSSDSIYNDVNNETINNDGVLTNHEAGGVEPNLEPVFEFDLIGLEEKDFGGNTTEETYNEDSNITQVNVDYGLTEFSPISEDSEELLYVGTQQEFDEDNLVTYSDGWFEGYETFKENLYEFQVLQEASIFENLIDDESLQQFQENYPNQLVWGGSYILESNASGTRDFEFTNFKNISQDYGEIVAISYINNILLVFCERGVNRINIGEVLTQQSDSQVFVDSSALLNNDQWILKNVPDIKPRSVTQYEDMLFFCDGKDVWKYTDTLQNISSGKVAFDIDQTFEGSVDPKNKEYQLTNGDQTWVYSIELDLWQGPFTYKIETASAYRDNFYGVVGNDSVEFNSGNTFDGSSYDTVIESVANTLDDASVTKLFRKFYVETEGDATFSYGKEYGTWTDKSLSNYPDKNGVTHLGVNPSNKNGRQMYWKVTTQEQDFILQLVSLLCNIRKRR